MALGGGTFISQCKILPGSYINFVNVSKASSALSERGIATMPLELDWGEDTVFAVTAKEFQENSMRFFGYPYGHEKLKGLRDLFSNIKTGYFYKLNNGSVKAANSYATARCGGSRGNDLKIVVTDKQIGVYEVSTWLDGVCVDVQTVSAMGELSHNDFVIFNLEAELNPTAGMSLSGGNNGTVEESAYQRYLDKIEALSFHTIGCLSTEDTVKSLFINFTKRMRDDCGIKIQTVLFRPAAPDHEGIIGLENGLAGDSDNPAAVYWVTGAQAGCAVNKSLTGTTYAGAYLIDTDYTQSELEKGLSAGKLLFHKCGDSVRVLEDVNTFVSVTDEKSADFSSNQMIRVLDQIGNDVAALFNEKYMGKVPNDSSGRISLWNDIVRHHQELQKIRAIENFSGEHVVVEPGESKKSVVVTDHVTLVNCMAQLYMTIVVQ